MGEISITKTEKRYTSTIDGFDCFIEYKMVNESTINLYHTYVAEELRGQGIAKRLIMFALKDAKSLELKVIPSCSAVEVFIERYPEYKALT